MPIKSEGGLRNHRIEYVEETVTADGDPETPADPAWSFYSDNVRDFEWSPGPSSEPQRGIGDVDPQNHFHGPEEHQLTVTYDLQQAITSDASYDGVNRGTDNQLANSHTVVDREAKSSIAPSSTINGSTSKDTRVYTVGVGGYIDEATWTGDPGSQQPVVVELSYEFERVRTYQIDQPGSASELDVVSSDANDTTQTLTIEDEGAGTSTDVSLNGTTTVTTTGTTFSDIDSLYLDAETAGDITISESGGDDLAIIRGSSSYDDVEGDLGVPALGSGGSHASALGNDYELFLGDTIQRGGADIGTDINSFSLTVSNNTERTTRHDSFGQRIHVGVRDTSVSASVAGETDSHALLEDALMQTQSDIVWTLTNSTITVSDAVLSDPGSRAINTGQAVMNIDTTFDGEGLTIA